MSEARLTGKGALKRMACTLTDIVGIVPTLKGHPCLLTIWTAKVKASDGQAELKMSLLKTEDAHVHRSAEG